MGRVYSSYNTLSKNVNIHVYNHCGRRWNCNNEHLRAHLSLVHSHSLTLTQSLSHPLTLSLFHSLFVSLSLSLSLSHSLSLSLSLSLCPSLPLPFPLSLPLSLSLSLFASPFPSHSLCLALTPDSRPHYQFQSHIGFKTIT